MEVELGVDMSDGVDVEQTVTDTTEDTVSEAAQAVQKAVDEMKNGTSNGEGNVAKKRTRKAAGEKKAKAPKKAKAAKTPREKKPKGEAAFININVGKDIKKRLLDAKKETGKSLNEIVSAALDKAL
jgi:hypothetical protein